MDSLSSFAKVQGDLPIQHVDKAREPSCSLLTTLGIQ